MPGKLLHHNLIQLSLDSGKTSGNGSVKLLSVELDFYACKHLRVDLSGNGYLEAF